MRSFRLRNDEAGFTLIELLVTMLVLAVGLAGAIAMIDGASARTTSTKQREAATGLAREILEDARSVPYDRLTPSGMLAELQSLPGLGDGTPSTSAWTVERRGTEYTVLASVCSLDDQKDGYGAHDSGTFCGGATGTSDRSPDDYKRVTVELRWKRGQVDRSLEQTGIVANESSTTGPSVEIVGQSPGGDLITDDGVNTITFDVETSEPAAAIKYSVDGVVEETDTPSGTTASFSWRIDEGPDGHIPDGTYVISVTAFDAEGKPGVVRARTIRLNRDEPEPTDGPFGGWNARLDVVDLEWNRNPEPDVIGYRMYRETQSGGTVVVSECSTTTDPNLKECSDTSPPTEVSVYWLVALDEDPFTGSPREGQPGPLLTVTPTNTQPNPPAGLAGLLSEGNGLLTWTAPAPANPPYTGDGILYFRVYRDGTALSDRIGRTGTGTDSQFTDTGFGGSHQYWVTAVDQNYSESDPLGPVSLP